MDYSPTVPNHRQSYVDGINHRCIQRMPSARNESMREEQRHWHSAVPYQQGWSENQTPEKQFQSSYPDLSDQFSQDSAYHSRHSSSVDAVEPNSIGSQAYLGSRRGHVHGPFSSRPDAGPQAPRTTQAASTFTTSREEVITPRTSRKIFEEAAARNSRPVKERSYNKMVLRPSESYRDVHREHEEVRRPSDAVPSPRFDSVSAQPLRTKSFSGVRSQPTGVSSMTQLAQYNNRGDGTVIVGNQCLEGNNSTFRHRLFYNTMTQTESTLPQNEAYAASWTNNQWQDLRNTANTKGVQSGHDIEDTDNGRPLTSPKQFTKDFTANSVPEGRLETEKMRKSFSFDKDVHNFSGLHETSPNRALDDLHSSGDAVDPSRGYSLNQSSMLRRLSKELYGQKLGIGQSGKKSFVGDKHHRLGSIDENSQSCETSRRSLGARRKSSSEVEQRLRNQSHGLAGRDFSPSDSSLSPKFSDHPPPSNEPENSGFLMSDDDPGDGCNFVRNRKCQMSLRKAFGIFDEFEIIEDTLRNRPPERNSKGGVERISSEPASCNAVPISLSQKYSEGSGFRQDLRDSSMYDGSNGQKSLPQLSMETGWQDSSFNADAASARSKLSIVLQSQSGPAAVARRKATSMPRQQTMPLMSAEDESRPEPGTSTSYTGTGVLSSHRRKLSHENLQYPRNAGEEQELYETYNNVEESCAAGGCRDRLESPKGAMSFSSAFSGNNSPSSYRDSSVLRTDDVVRDIPVNIASSNSSPSPPMLPPRQYRKGSAGDDQRTDIGDEFTPKGAELYSSAGADDDPESTIKRNSYAQQLRQQARRLSSHSSTVIGGSSFLHRRPPPPLASVNSDNKSNYVSETWWNPETGVAAVSERTSALEHSENSPMLEDFRENYEPEHARTSSRCFEAAHSRENSDGFQNTVYGRASNSSTDVTTADESSFDRGESHSSLPVSEDGVLLSSYSSRWTTPLEVASESHDRRSFLNSLNTVDSNTSYRQNQNDEVGLQAGDDIEAQSFSEALETEAEAKHQQKITSQKSNKHKRKADMAVVQPSVRSAEVVAEKCASLSPSNREAEKGPSPSKLGKVRGYPRPWKPVAESTYDSAAAVVFQKLPDEERVSSESSIYDRPMPVVNNRLPDEETGKSKSPRSNQPRSVIASQLEKNKLNFSETVMSDGKSMDERKKFPERLSFDRPCSIVIQQTSDEQKRPTGTILPSPQQKTTADYMTGLFTSEEDGSTVQTDTLTRNSFQRASLRSRLMAAKQTKAKMESVTLLPEEEQSLVNELNGVSLNFNKNSGDDDKEISEEEKLDLINVLEKKLESLQGERQLLNDEIVENNVVGNQVTAVVEQKLSTKEFSKYRSYVDELEKVLYLLLKLSERLAKAENAVSTLPQNASDKEKTNLISKCNELVEKRNDALSLKEGIDRRRHQVDGYLQNCLSDDELKDYEYFIKMKAQLVIEQQEVEDRIEMGQRQLDLLKCTLNCNFESKSDGYFGPKSDC